MKRKQNKNTNMDDFQLTSSGIANVNKSTQPLRCSLSNLTQPNRIIPLPRVLNASAPESVKRIRPPFSLCHRHLWFTPLVSMLEAWKIYPFRSLLWFVWVGALGFARTATIPDAASFQNPRAQPNRTGSHLYKTSDFVSHRPILFSIFSTPHPDRYFRYYYRPQSTVLVKFFAYPVTSFYTYRV